MKGIRYTADAQGLPERLNVRTLFAGLSDSTLTGRQSIGISAASHTRCLGSMAWHDELQDALGCSVTRPVHAL